MKHIVFLIGEYHPFTSPNGNIADSLIQEFQNKYEVTVITRKNDSKLEKEAVINGIKIIRIPDYNLSFHKLYTEKYSNSKHFISKFLYKNALLAKRILFFIPRLCRMQSISKYYTNRIQKELIKVNAKQNIDVLIPVSAPHEEVMAGVKFKKFNNKNLTLLIYQLDRFSNANSLYVSNIFKEKKVTSNINLEVEALNTCNRLFILPPLRQHYRNERFSDFQDKIIVTEHPLVKKIDGLDNKKILSDTDINILYAGSLDVKLRNPTYLFEIFNTEKIVKSNLKLNLYTFGNCQYIIDKYKMTVKGKIFDHGRVSFDEISNKMKKCDILLTIGNNSDNEVPSKLFEYLSYCKPIIHLYYSENDAYLEYLKSYKYSICLKMDECIVEENSKKFLDFCNRYKNANISFEEINLTFETCTPSFVAQQFTDDIDNDGKF